MKFQIRNILRLEKDVAVPTLENLPLEIERPIFVNEKLYAMALLTPSQEKEFTAGHLYSEGIIETVDQIVKLEINDLIRVSVTPLDVKNAVTTPDPAQTPKVSGRSILACLESILDSELHNKTGGTHASALCRDDRILITAEDVSRLNTLDKILGWALLEGVDFRDCYVATSGRITGRTVKKAARFGIPLVASKGAVSTLAADLAGEIGLTLVGFARKERMNIYTGSSRIVR